MPIDQSLLVIAILEAIMKSSQLNAEVTLPDFATLEGTTTPEPVTTTVNA